MSKSKSLFVSILLIISAAIIYALMHNKIPYEHFDLVGFYIGFIFIMGVGYSILPFIRKRE